MQRATSAMSNQQTLQQVTSDFLQENASTLIIYTVLLICVKVRLCFRNYFRGDITNYLCVSLLSMLCLIRHEIIFIYILLE